MANYDQHKPIDIYGDLSFDGIKLDEVGLTADQIKELRSGEEHHSGFYIKIVADAIESFVSQNERLQADRSDEELQKLMDFSAKFCERTYAMGLAQQKPGGPEWVRNWLNKQNPRFMQHAEAYQELYQKIGHLTEKPYFLSAWSMAFIVDIALEVEGVKDPFDYMSLPNKRMDFLKFSMEYAEHWITVFYQHVGFEG